ncbi:MAG: TetR/AcrR family transcriptional regulator [Bacteroidota bacterium]
MGIKERRQREIETLKASILKATRSLAIELGWEKVSIRKISDRIEYTPPVIYEHFENKEAILIELEVMGFRNLKYVMDDARQTVSDPLGQMKAVSAAFWDWAFQHAELYQVMFNLEGVKAHPASRQSLKECSQSVIEILRSGQLFSTDTDELFFHWWSIMHGHVSLVQSGQVAGVNNLMRRSVLAAVERLMKSL